MIRAWLLAWSMAILLAAAPWVRAASMTEGCPGAEGVQNLAEYYEVSDEAMLDSLSYMLQKTPLPAAVLHALGGIKDKGTKYREVYKPGQGPFGVPAQPPNAYLETLGQWFVLLAAVDTPLFSPVLDRNEIVGEISNAVTYIEYLANVSAQEFRRLTLASLASDGTSFDTYLADAPRWGVKLASLATCPAFEAYVEGFPDKVAIRRRMDILLYKLSLLNRQAAAAVWDAWRARPRGSMLELATNDPWPPNYFARLWRAGVDPINPVAEPVKKVAEMVALWHWNFRSCANRGCVPISVCHTETVQGQIIWEMLDGIYQAPAWRRFFLRDYELPGGRNPDWQPGGC